jgi:hypothetical protein
MTPNSPNSGGRGSPPWFTDSMGNTTPKSPIHSMGGGGNNNKLGSLSPKPGKGTVSKDEAADKLTHSIMKRRPRSRAHGDARERERDEYILYVCVLHFF